MTEVGLFQLLVGFCVSSLVALTGLGAGSIMTPILLLFFKYAPSTAVATDIWFALVIKIVCGFGYQRQNQVNWKIVKRMATGSVPMALVIVSVMSTGTIHQVTSHLTRYVIIAMQLLTIYVLLQDSQPIKFGKKYQRIISNPSLPTGNRLFETFIGAIIGFIVSVSSIGAGVIGTMYLVSNYYKTLSMSEIVATEIMHAIPLCLVCGLGYLFFGQVDYSLLAYLLLGGDPWNILGPATIQNGQLKTAKITDGGYPNDIMCLLIV